MATRTLLTYTTITDYTDATEATFAATLTGRAYGYALIYNTTKGVVRIWDGSAFTNNTDAIVSKSLTTTDATLTTIDSIAISTVGGYVFVSYIEGIDPISGDCIGIRMTTVCKYFGGILSIVSTPDITRISNFSAAITSSATISGSSLLLQIKGKAGTTINWVIKTQLTN